MGKIFLGREFEIPFIASSCIATENINNIIRLEKSGVQAVILKSCADYERHEMFAGKRVFAKDENGYTYASSPFEKEILTLSEAVSLIREVKERTSLMVIPSVTATSLNLFEWQHICKEVEKAGADAIQLDFFYMGNLIGTPNFVNDFVNLLEELISNIGITIIPKLNVNLPKDFIMPLLVRAGVEYVSLLDSIRVPFLEKNDIASENCSKYSLSTKLNEDECSCFGSWQLPLTMSYTRAAVKAGLRVIAGGGIENSDDVKKLLVCGAEMIQSATFITKNPESICQLFV